MTKDRHTIARKVRRGLLDGLATSPIRWAGRLTDHEFLGRIWDLSALQSYDSRYQDAGGDIYQHTVNNDDWEPNWVYDDARFDLVGCDDATFLEFLSEMVAPAVRADPDQAEQLVRYVNECLRTSGFQFRPVRLQPVLGGPPRAIYEATSLAAPTPLELGAFQRLQDPGVLEDHLFRIDAAVDADPAAAIGSAKELVESLCHVILEDYGVTPERRDDVLDLYKQVAGKLRLNAESVPSSAAGSAAAQKALRALVTTIQSLAELRNQIGLGHGRGTSSPALARHARLASTAARAVAEFLLETWHVRRAQEAAARSAGTSKS